MYGGNKWCYSPICVLRGTTRATNTSSLPTIRVGIFFLYRSKDLCLWSHSGCHLIHYCFWCHGMSCLVGWLEICLRTLARQREEDCSVCANCQIRLRSSRRLSVLQKKKKHFSSHTSPHLTSPRYVYDTSIYSSCSICLSPAKGVSQSVN